MKTKYKGLLIKRKEGTNQLICEEIKINRKKSLEELYQYLDCSNIDIQERYINNQLYDFIFDDEYLINDKAKEPSKAVAIGSQKTKLLEIIYGSLFICGLANENGQETDLKSQDINNILNSLIFVENKTNGERYQVINYNFELEERNTNKDD